MPYLKHLICFLILFNNQISISQSVCAFNSYQSFDLCLNTNSGSHNSISMNHVIDNILNPMGLLRKNFIVKDCDNIQNAFATIYKDVRYIVMDERYFHSIYDNYQIAYYLILAHEIAHHLNGHTIEGNDNDYKKSQQKELECDYFAGVALANLGFALNDITAEAKKLLYDPAYNIASSHPPLSKRIEAISDGFTTSKNKKDEFIDQIIKIATEEYDKVFEKNLQNKISFLYNEAKEELIDIVSNNRTEGLEELINKYHSLDHIAPDLAFIKVDIAQLHQRNNNFLAAYSYFLSAYKLNDNIELLIDAFQISYEYDLKVDENIFSPLTNYNYHNLDHPSRYKSLAIYLADKNRKKSIEILSYALKRWDKFELFDWEYFLEPNLYNDLSILLLRQGQNEDAYISLKKAYQLYDIDAKIGENLNTYDKKDFGTIISNKALTELRLNQWLKCINTCNLLISYLLESNSYTNGSIDYFTGRSYYETKNYSKAIVYLSEAIKKSNSMDLLYYYRGLSYLKLGEDQKAMIDLTISCDLGLNSACVTLKNKL